tara:strand:- start:185 stop:889 length:705 start_codon:yes stop_codon:yes gene_type:complete
MIKELELETYLYISSSEFGIYLLDTQKLINLYENKIEIKNKDNVINLNVLKDFLEDNIFKIEKLIGRFIKDISLIIENDKVINVNLCIKKKNYEQNINQKYLQNMLTDAKDLFKENYHEYKIMHMVVNKFLINGNDYSKFLSNMENKEFNLEIEFIIISNEFINRIDHVLKNYQIKSIKCLSKKYTQNLFSLEDMELSVQSHKILNGYNENEVLFVLKKLKKQGFFEKFFQLFS